MPPLDADAKPTAGPGVRVKAARRASARLDPRSRPSHPRQRHNKTLDFQHSRVVSLSLVYSYAAGIPICASPMKWNLSVMRLLSSCL